jgi:hypothetical protein
VITCKVLLAFRLKNDKTVSHKSGYRIYDNCGGDNRVMNLRLKSFHIAILLIVFFVSSFLAVFLTVTLTEYGYSTPSVSVSGSVDAVGPVGFSLGPSPNSTNVPLDTKIVVYTMRPTTVKDLHLTPEASVGHECSSYGENGLSGKYTFYLNEPLKTATTYNASVFIMDQVVSWNFTTTRKSLESGISFYIATNVFGIALAIATIGTFAIGGLIWIKRRH